MIKNIQRTYFELWGEIESQNKLLKGLFTFAIILCAIETVALTSLSLRKPVLIGISENSSEYLKSNNVPVDYLDSEIKRAISRFLTQHYQWEFGSMETTLKEAVDLVAPDFRKKFLSSTGEQIKLAKDKKLSQRFYISDLKVDKLKKKVTVQGDRIIIIDSLRAVNSIAFEVAYEFGARTEKNKEGIYVVSETMLNNGL